MESKFSAEAAFVIYVHHMVCRSLQLSPSSLAVLELYQWDDLGS